MTFALDARPPNRRLAWPLAFVAAAALFGLGCSKDASTSIYPEESYAYGGELPEAEVVDITGAAEYRMDGEYDFAGDLASDADRSMIAAPPARGPQKTAELQAGKDAGKDAAGGDEAGKGEPAVAKDDDKPDHGRQIIYVAGMQVSVYSLEEAMNAVEAMPDTYGGWVHQRTQNQVVLRLPAIQLKPAMAALAKLGVVEARTLQAQDVTAEYVDLDSRIKVLRETQEQLLDLLAKAKTVEEALHVRRALDEVTMELELALGRMRQLSDMIAYSTLTVTLIERGPQDSIPTSNDPFRWVDSLGVEATEWR